MLRMAGTLGCSAHAAKPAGCWGPVGETLAIEQTSGRQRINIHGALDLEAGQTRMIEVLTVDAASTIRLLEAIEALYPFMALIHVYLDNARYHHARLVRAWLARPGCRRKSTSCRGCQIVCVSEDPVPF